jgi:hypothetical protein
MSRPRASFVAPVAAVLVIGAVAALALFQPWKLWVDERVDAVAPAGAVAIGPAAAAPTTPSAPSTAAAPVTTLAPPGAPAAAPDTAPATTAATPVAPETTTAPEPVTTAPPPASFVSIDHGTSGQVVLLADADGRRYVRFVDLATDNGPDLKVYLSTNPVDGPEGAFDDDIVNLGGLQGNLGSQNYEIPADVDLSRFRSVVIWCDRFDSAFGAAPLSA